MSRKWQKDRHYNGDRKRTNNDIQKTMQKPNDPANPTKNWG